MIFQKLGIRQHNRMPTFVEFLEFILMQKNERLDIHFRSQTAVSHFGEIDYNFIGYFEDFENDLLKIFSKLGYTYIDE